MPEEGLPPAAQNFIRQYIQSVEQLEILLLLRSQPAVEWTAKGVFDVIKSSERSAAYRLEEFSARHLLTRADTDPPTYRYKPNSPDLARAVDETAQAYQIRRILVIETIFKSETNPAQSFADAFKFKK